MRRIIFMLAAAAALTTLLRAFATGLPHLSCLRNRNVPRSGSTCCQGTYAHMSLKPSWLASAAWSRALMWVPYTNSPLGRGAAIDSGAGADAGGGAAATRLGSGASSSANVPIEVVEMMSSEQSAAETSRRIRRQYVCLAA